jgi:aspartate 1-decarboxylase
MLKAKIHRAKVTEVSLDYIGSITIDEDLLKAAEILVHEKVQVADLTNGVRFETYTIAGKPGSGEICVNGAAAKIVKPNDLIIIFSYCLVNEDELAGFTSTIVTVDDLNQITNITRNKIV